MKHRIDAEEVDFLDRLAAAVERDRSYLLNEAVESYIDLKKWNLEEAKAAMAEANCEDEVRAAFTCLQRDS